MIAAGLLAMAVAGTWLGCLGLFRLPTAFDRLHLVAFVNVVGGGGVLAAAMLAEGATPRVFKIGAIVAVNLLTGAAGSHAIGRALLIRGDR